MAAHNEIITSSFSRPIENRWFLSRLSLSPIPPHPPFPKPHSHSQTSNQIQVSRDCLFVSPPNAFYLFPFQSFVTFFFIYSLINSFGGIPTFFSLYFPFLIASPLTPPYFFALPDFSRNISRERQYFIAYLDCGVSLYV